jgi:hypothetical protein
MGIDYNPPKVAGKDYLTGYLLAIRVDDDRGHVGKRLVAWVYTPLLFQCPDTYSYQVRIYHVPSFKSNSDLFLNK